MTRKLAWIAAPLIACGGAAAQEAHIRPQVPIIIRADAKYDACGGSGVVVDLDPRGDGFLAVKGGPGLSYPRIDKLYNGEQVYLCGERGDWYAVVYTKARRDCNVMTPWPATLPYTGPCRSGWVFKRYIRPFAG
jgi:hypothetical protein